MAPRRQRLNGSKQQVILVVEDDEVVRFVAAHYLSGVGFLVLEAANADAARALIESVGDIDLVFSDINMPGRMDGRAFAEWILTKRPTLPVILTSGNVHSNASITMLRRFVGKPYELEALEKQIRALLQ